VADADAVGRLRAALGPLAEPDVIVCAAGVMSERTAKTMRTTPQEWRRVLGVNLDGVQHVVAAFAPAMIARRDGRIVTVSACLGRMSGPGTSGGLAAYRVSKAAVNAWTKNLAAELGDGRRGVLVDATCPAHCRTDMGGADAPRSAEQGAATAVWLACRPAAAPGGAAVPTGLLWEDREVVAW
jgi:NAD(P)-dependent dehydrogenase (short-subunit alcohol dehydrogenase family)